MTNEEINKKRQETIEKIKIFLKKEATDSDLEEIAFAMILYDDEYGIDCIKHINT